MNNQDQEPKPGGGNSSPLFPDAGSTVRPGGTGWPPDFPAGAASANLGPLAGGPPRRGLFREHPFIMILIIFLLGAAVLSIVAAALSRRKTTGGVSAMSFGKKVGVVKIEGIIMEAKPVVDQLHRFRDDGTVAAVVLRVESPGGTVGASQEIYTEVKKLAEQKPLVVSMGSVAASGGYYVSCPARLIYANPGTITGSIGVVMDITNLEGLFKWMRIKNETIKSGAFKDTGSPYRPMTPEEREYLQRFVDDAHHQFEEVVAKGRKLPPQEVHKIADGRIFTGTQAKNLKLVDELGNLWDAIAKAAELGGIKGEPAVIWPPQRPWFLESMFQNLFPGWKTAANLLPSPVQIMYIVNIE